MKTMTALETNMVAGAMIAAPAGSPFTSSTADTNDDWAPGETNSGASAAWGGFCGGLGDTAGAAAGRAVGAVNLAVGAGVGEAVREGVTQCCTYGSFDACFGRSMPPPPDYGTGGAGASGGW